MSWRRIGFGIAVALLAADAAHLHPFAYPARAEAPAAQRFDRGLLWKIEGSGAPASYLFGTIHIGDKRVTELPDVVKRSLDKAHSFTMEVTLDAANVVNLAARMVYQDGRDLKGVIGGAMYGKLVAANTGVGMPDELLRVLKPWAAALLLVVPPQNSGEILDNVLFGIASQQQKAIYQLESVDEQVAAFEGLSESDQVAMLGQALESRDRMPQETEELVEAYLRRDLAGMWRINEESGRDAPEYGQVNRHLTRRLLDERNARMVERMRPQLKSGNAFIAVGALHLYGARGLLNLLAQRGYRLTPLY